MDKNNYLTMQDAIQFLGIAANPTQRTVNVMCPSCGKNHHEKKLNINIEKGVFRCAKCGVAGGVMKLWGLFRGLDDPKEAALDYYKFVEGRFGSSLKAEIKTKPLEPSVSVETAPIESRHKTYSELLSLLTLKEQHEENLRKRGLSDEAIEKNGYKSFPVVGRQSLASMLQNRGCLLKGIPGFYQDDAGNWTIRRLPDGFLIPQRDGFGRIQGLQLRCDEGDVRYLTLSTDNFLNGAKGSAYVHLAKGCRGLSDVIITEGPLKGDIISFYTGYSVLAVQGVCSISRLDSILAQLIGQGTENIFTAFDMDILEKEEVQKAMGNLATKIESAGLSYRQLVWDPSQKGLDDWLNSRK